MEKKKIVFFVDSLHCGGAERSLLSLLSNLDPDKYNIDLLVIRKGGEFEKFIPEWIKYKSLDLNFSLIGRVKYKLLRILNYKVHNAQLFWRSFKNEIKTYEETYDIAVGWGQGFATYFTAEKIKAKRKYLQLYLNEFIYKLNRRYFGDRLFERLIIANITGL